MINKVTLVGHLGSDPEVRHLENGAAVAKLSVATNESYKDNMGNWQDRTEWHRVVAWRFMAEKAEKFKKGNLIYLEGKLTTRKWQDKNGADQYTTEVVASYMRNITSKDGGGGSGYFPSAEDDPYSSSGNNDDAKTSANTATTSNVSETTATDASVSDSADDDLPF